MNLVVQQLARCLGMCIAFATSAASAVDAAPQAERPASAKPEAKRSLPAAKKGDAPVRWDRLDPSTVERASKAGAPKAPMFPAERL